MPRTRDLFLFGTIVCFLVVAIGGTVLSRTSSTTSIVSPVLTTTAPVDYTATVVASGNSLDRNQRVISMREKVAAAYEEVSESVSESIEPETIEEAVVDASGTSTAETPRAQLECASPTPYVGNWDPSGLAFMTSEGVRVVYRELPAMAAASSSLGTTETVLQLPIRAFPDARPQCVTSDVIGVAQDGSLIRNSETGLYSVFTEETLIGFALDGFPIYGVTTRNTDVCGGAVTAGQYGYYLSESRDVILGCFAAPPVNLTNYGNARF